MNGAPSSEHSNVEPVSVDVNSNVAVEELDGFGGDSVIVVSGAVASIVQENDAGVESVFPAGSTARTSNV